MISTIFFIFLQFQFVMMRTNQWQGYVAIDEIEFRYIEACEFTPPDAKPVPTTTMLPTTTTVAPTTTVTTVEPTEPPDCEY